MKLNYKKMVEDIDKIVNNDLCADLEMRLMPNQGEISQEDAKTAIDIIGKVYMISHGITCSACNKKYITK
jgi:hypothetical protein